MQEITSDIIIETTYLGVTLGAINTPHGLVLIDAPLKIEDARSWRATLVNLGGGVDRLLINLDAHPDRTLGSRSMECTIVGHDMIAQAFRNRPTTFKSQNTETGADWEYISNLGTIRWNPPEISFSNSMRIQWGKHIIQLIHKPGPNAAAIWAEIPDEKIVFVGDCVVADQPPFISQADFTMWIGSLQELLSPAYQEYFIISGRGGLITQEDIRKQITLLEKIQPLVEAYADQKLEPEDLDQRVRILLAPFNYTQDRELQYTQRLRWGITHYRIREALTNSSDIDE